jgi:hypothetical protein
MPSPSELELVRQIHLTRINSKSEPNEDLEAEILRRFHLEPPDAIRWTFETWRDDSQWFPAVSDVRKLFDRWHREKREAAEIEAKRREKEAIEQARREGKLLDFADVVKQMRETLNIQPEPEHVRRQREFTLRMQRGRS